MMTKGSFFQAADVLILLYGCTTWTLTIGLEKKLDGNYTRILRAILNKSWREHPTRHQLYGHLPPITKTIKIRGTRHAGHCWRSRDKLISDVLLWTPTYGRAKAGLPARTYIQQLCEDTGCSSEDLPEAMNDREKWRESVRVPVLAARHDDEDETINHIVSFCSKLTQKDYKTWHDWLFLSLRFFGLLSPSLLLFSLRFGRYVLRLSSGVCRTREPARNFELRPLLNPWVSLFLIPLAITGSKCYVFLYW